MELFNPGIFGAKTLKRPTGKPKPPIGKAFRTTGLMQ
jgi:hypothetical protein